MNAKFFLTGLVAGLCVFAQLEALAANNLPKDAPKDVKYILGFYYGNGENIIIRENNGELELLYKTRMIDNSFKLANVFPLLKEHFDLYTLIEAGPIRVQEGSVQFQRDKDGYGVSLKAGGRNYTRRFMGKTIGDKTSNFKIKSHTSEEWAELRKQAKEATMSASLAQGERAELVDASTVQGLNLDNVYARADNLFQAPLYEETALKVGSFCADALSKVNERLKAYGLGLILWDAYRPWHISKLANLALPSDGKAMLDDPDTRGSSHNTGNAVDVSLYDLETGEPLEMISTFDEPSPRQYSSYAGGTTRQRFLRDLLRTEMELAGFKGIEMEWWHFEFGDISKLSKLNE